MTKISFLDISAGLEKQYFKNIKQADRFLFSRVVANKTRTSRKKKNKLKERSLMFLISNLWKGLDSSVVNVWNDVASFNNMSGFQLFMKEQSLHIQAGFSDVATPSYFHQGKVGEVSISSPSLNFKIKQNHSHNYWLLKKVVSKKTMQAPLYITEDFAMPLTLGINYSSALEVAGDNPFARYFATIRSSYQGLDVFTDLIVDLDFSCSWQNIEKTFSDIVGQFVSYDVSIELNDLQGFLFFDNIKIYHSGQNWAFDSFCNNISKKNTFPFNKVVNSWEEVSVPVGSSYCSKYKKF